MTGPQLSRRGLFTGGAAALGGAVAGGAVVTALRPEPAPAPPPAPDLVDFGQAIEPFHGARQAGVETVPQAHAAFVAFTLRPGTDRAALGRMMRLLSDDAARLTRGEAPLADTEAELAVVPARLTVTFGFGPGLYAAAGLPSPVAALPAFPQIDRLEERWNGGDLLIQICADDSITVAHAQRMLIKDSRPFATVRWVQRGFRRSAGTEASVRTQRNLLGQLDGTANPAPGTASFGTAVWREDGSTQLVVRRIRAELESWDLLGRADKENAVGRKLDSGAPLTGVTELDEPDFARLDATGFPVMPDFAHVTRARQTDDRLKIVRRPYNYDDAPAADGTADCGLIFASYQADIVRQYLPIQRRLAEKDLLNEWITPIGSAVFSVPPGAAEGGWVGQGVLA
ncbi:Dyp-type peroxidase [Catenuloplanes atrovinosus]|uniref:Dye decolorizing peroxidase n=1 Tax=Catenuloplanes atrovinosus TaxID=137266 RepID=A0AAE4CCN6_9ACTN|nr:Dyp-type peroxidase [Catenuloplanes atrovinosus]MDR7276705.1 dye decolorizing peroxidase [Catenuloplanes atrovinosus]